MAGLKSILPAILGRKITPTNVYRGILDLTPLRKAFVWLKPERAITTVTPVHSEIEIVSFPCPHTPGVKYFDVLPGERGLRRVSDFGTPEDKQALYERIERKHETKDYLSRAMRVVLLENVDVFLPEGTVTLNGKIVEEACTSVRTALRPSYYLDRMRLKKFKIPGDRIFLPILHWRAYGHWTTDLLTRIDTLERCPELPKVPYLFPDNPAQFHLASLKAAGITEDQLDRRAPGRYRVERLWLPVRIMEHNNTHPKAFEWLRKRILPNVPLTRSGRRVLISRADATWRRMVNEDALMEALAPWGFERIILGKLSWEDQVRVFAEAELVMGPHGAGMANIVYSPPNATLVEFFTPTLIDNTFVFCAHVGGLKHGVIFGEDVGRDMHIPVEKVLAILDEIGLSRA